MNAKDSQAESLGSALSCARPLFLIGCPRSGTTFTTRLLNSHPRLLLTNESAVFMLLDDIIKKSGKGIASGILYGKDYHTLLSSLMSDNYRRLIESFYSRIAGVEGRAKLDYWGEKPSPQPVPGSA